MTDYQPVTPAWGHNFRRMKKSSLKSMLRRYEKLHTHKLTVMTQHKPGTSYHTRAQREADTYAERIETLKKLIK